jgi:hypothetical protein
VPKSIKLKSFPPDQKRGLNFVTDVGFPKICLIAGLKSQDSFFLNRGVIWLFNNNNKDKSINIYLFIFKSINHPNFHPRQCN